MRCSGISCEESDTAAYSAWEALANAPGHPGWRKHIGKHFGDFVDKSVGVGLRVNPASKVVDFQGELTGTLDSGALLR